MILNLFD